MQDRALADPRIRVIWDTEVTEALGLDRLAGLRLRHVVSGKESELAVTGLFVAIGHDPRSELVMGQVSVDAAGYVLAESPTTMTNLSGVFAAGDLVDHRYRQAITAAGTGCAAAMDAERFLAEQSLGGSDLHETADYDGLHSLIKVSPSGAQ
jgi:thioredoxin reductase (NADPH)